MLRMSLVGIPRRFYWVCCHILGAARQVISIYKQMRSKGMFPLDNDKFRMNLKLPRLQTEDHGRVDGRSRGYGESLNLLDARN